MKFIQQLSARVLTKHFILFKPRSVCFPLLCAFHLHWLLKAREKKNVTQEVSGDGWQQFILCESGLVMSQYAVSRICMRTQGLWWTTALIWGAGREIIFIKTSRLQFFAQKKKKKRKIKQTKPNKNNQSNKQQQQQNKNSKNPQNYPQRKEKQPPEGRNFHNGAANKLAKLTKKRAFGFHSTDA